MFRSCQRNTVHQRPSHPVSLRAAGNFSFGGMHKFRSNTIVDFIENAVEYSRSGRYLFFLHRRPAHGPMRVQLLHPVSRFKHIQSLKHLCRSAQTGQAGRPVNGLVVG